MPSRRMFQVNELLRQEISQIVLTELNDPRLRLVTITSVHTSADLHHARVYYQFHGGEADRQSAQQGLQHAGGRIRHLLGKRVRIKYLPELAFEYDDRLDYAQRINEKLKSLKAQQDSPEREKD